MQCLVLSGSQTDINYCHLLIHYLSSQLLVTCPVTQKNLLPNPLLAYTYPHSPSSLRTQSR